MKMRNSLIAATLFLSLAAHAQTTVQQSGFSPVYVGVDYETAVIQGAPSNPPVTAGPEVSRAYIMRIDLKAPGISLITTKRDSAFGPPEVGGNATVSEPISQFAADYRVRGHQRKLLQPLLRRVY
jgi:hypothetical protein